jgi:hypothetical protein
MYKPIYVDDYGIADTTYLVHAVPFEAFSEDPQKVQRWSLWPWHRAWKPDIQQWHIGLLFSIGGKACNSVLTYPTQDRRDHAFAKLCTLVGPASERSAALDAEGINDCVMAIGDIEATLGMMPQGPYTSLAARLDAIEAAITAREKDTQIQETDHV